MSDIIKLVPDIEPEKEVDAADAIAEAAAEVVQNCVELLEGKLEEVKSGDTIAVMLVTKSKDGSWNMSSSDYIELAAALGQLEMIKFNLVFGTAVDDDCDCDDCDCED